MKKLLLIFLLLPAIKASAQRVLKSEKASDHSTRIKGNNFEGCIFSDNYIGIFPGGAESKPFTPSIEEVALAEKLLRQAIDTIHFYGHERFVRNNLRKYLRQYFGYINSQGERIIEINALWKRDEDEDSKWLTGREFVNDGGDHYWQIKINLTNKECFAFSVNGEG